MAKKNDVANETEELKMSMADYSKFWNRHAKGDPIIFAPNDPLLDVGFIETGIAVVDEAMGGGVPRGRLSMFFGENSSGKTLLAQLVMAEVQRKGGIVLYIDGEHTYTPEWFKATGVDLDPSKFLVLRPRSLEQAIDMMVHAQENLKPDLIVYDSIPSILPAAHMEADMEDKDFRGDTARKLSEGLTKVVQTNSGKTAVILINQMRVNMGVVYGNPESLPGGKALSHLTALRVRVRRGGWITETSSGSAGTVSEDNEGGNAKKTGFVLKIRVEKNKSAIPWQECEFRFFFTGELDSLGLLIGSLVEKELMTVSKGFYRSPLFEGTIHGRDALEKRLKENPELLEAFEEGLKGLV